MTEKELYLESEGDAWFERNGINKSENWGVSVFCDFYNRMRGNLKFQYKNTLEIGCSYGYGLKKLADDYGFICYGVDPITKGNIIWKRKIQ